MTKMQKLSEEMNREFRNHLHDQFLDKFGKEIVTEFNLFSGCLVSTLIDNSDFTQQEANYIDGYSDGYAKAMNMTCGR